MIDPAVSYVPVDDKKFMETCAMDTTRKKISFAMRERVYSHAQLNALENSRVIIIFGAGRFSEWREMMTGAFSYIAIDPEVDTLRLTKWGKGFHVRPYDFSLDFESQVISISQQPLTVLWAKCKSEDFISRTMPIMSMASLKIPAVFPFSISYHIPIILELAASKISLFGCGYVHDDLPSSGVGYNSASMQPRMNTEGSIKEVVATFGKAVYVEPVLTMTTVPGLVSVKSFVAEIWKHSGPKDLEELMGRAVFMFA